jgi:hypothetical protein
LHAYGEAANPYNRFLEYPDYTMARFKADMAKLRANMPEKHQVQVLAEEKVLGYFTDQLKEVVGDAYKGNVTVNLVTEVFAQYANKNGDYYANAKTKEWIDPLAELMWDKIKKEATEQILGSTLASTFGVVEIAALPIQILETAWIMHISQLRNDDMKQALSWYVRERYAYDYERHRRLMQSGQNFRAIQWSPRFPWDFDPSSRDHAPYPFTTYGLEPYYISVDANSDVTWLLGDWDIFLGGGRYNVDDELQGFYDLWANIMYAEAHLNGTDLDKEIRALSKNAGTAYVRGILKRHADACLRDFIYEFEKYYYDLYVSYYLFEIRRAIATEAALVSILQYRDREILKEQAKTEAEYQQRVENYNQQIYQAGLLQTNAQQAEVVAEGYLEDRNDETNDNERCNIEADFVQEIITAMTNAAASARECESERVNYADYVDFVDQYGPLGTNYTTLECQDNRDTYLATYNPLEQDLNTRWNNNATEFATLRNEIVEMGQRVCGEDSFANKDFTPLYEYHRKVGNVPVGMLDDLTTSGELLFTWLWWTNFNDASVAYMQSLSPSTLGAISNDIDLVEQRLCGVLNTMDQLMEGYPTKEEIREIHTKAERAELIYNDLVKGHPSLSNPRGGWSSWQRSFAWGSATDIPSRYLRYIVNWSISANLNHAADGTDSTHFETDDYTQYAVHMLSVTSIDPLGTRDEAITNAVDYNPTEKFREVSTWVYNQVNTGLELVDEARDILSMEFARRDVTPDLHWYRLHEQPDQGLPTAASLPVPYIEGQGGCYSLSITTNDIGVIGFHTKGMRTVNVANPGSPVLLDSLSPTAFTHGTDVSGNTAFLSGYMVDVSLVDISNPTNLPDDPMVERFTVPDDGGQSYDVAVHGDYVYIADGPGGLKVYDTRTITNLVAGTPDGELAVSGPVGIAVDFPYAYLACGTNGFDVIDISTPTNPVLAAHKDTAPIDVAQVEVYDGYALLSLGSNGIAWLDCTTPTNPTAVSVDTEPGFYVQHAAATGDLIIAAGYVQNRNWHGHVQVYTLNNGLFLTRQQRYDLTKTARHVALHKGYAWISCAASSHLYSIELDRIMPSEAQRQTATEASAYPDAGSSYSFAPRVEVQAYGRGTGTITIEPGSLSTTDRIVTNVTTGTVLTVTAWPDNGIFFSGWEGYTSSLSTSVTFEVASNTYLAAHFMQPENVITSSAAAGGSIDPLGAVTVLVHDVQIFTISNSAGYVISNVFIDGTAAGSLDEYRFDNVTNAHAIHVGFAAVDGSSCGVAASAGPGGSVAPAGWSAFPAGNTITHTITADPQYRIINVAVDGTNYAALSEFVFTNIAGVHNLHAEFARESRLIDVVANGGGSAAPGTPYALDPAGTGITINITAAPWHYISAISSNDTAIGTWNQGSTSAAYAFTWPSTNITFDVTFAALETTNTRTPLEWLASHGITSDFENAVLLDPDEDTVPTWAEYVADTDPMVQTSHLHFSYAALTNLTGGSTGWVVSCSGSADRLYELEGATTLSPTATWQTLVAPSAGDGETMQMEITNDLPFLRLRATKP